MKKNILGLLSLILILLVVVGCENSKKKSTSDDKTITVAASPTPHAEILEHVAPLLEKEGYKLVIKKIDDFVMPNKALASGDVDANYFQHVPFFEKAVKENNYNFSIAGAVHIEPMGLYSKNVKKVKDLKDGAKIVTSDSVADWGRVISILKKAKLVEVKNGVNIENASFEDISKNPKHLKFVHNVKPEMLVQAYNNQEGDLVAINANFAYSAKLNPLKDSVLLEADNSPYVNIVATRKGQENSAKIKALIKILHEKKVQAWVLKTWGGSVKPVAADDWKK
ncbi:MAG: methionine ABC transporter substrate-binding protein [Streptococcaceae bacterium]|jgi:D-methionine transport system substrate-binding protein|nr:methionine ABC transporter substrate-binding protein [Streptococcaceae bacterium]